MSAKFPISIPDSDACRRLAEHDWSSSPLGLPETWPDAFKVALGVILRSPESMYLAWGPERLFFYNDAYAPILGSRIERSMGRPFAEVWADVWEQVRDAVEQTFAGASFRYEDQLLHMNRHGVPEETFWTYSFSPWSAPDGTVAALLCVTREQTVRVAAEQRQERQERQNTALIAEVEKGRDELARTEEQLRQSQKIEAIGQLTGGVAHDFNNLLTVIKGSVELLQRPDLPEERRSRYLAAIGDTAERAAKLTGQLLAFARRQALKPEVFDAGASLTEVSNMVRTLTGSRIELNVVVPRQAVSVLADRSQLDTAIVNMAVNARDAMEGAGKLTIAVGPVSGIPPIRSHNAVAGDFIAVTVADTGSGIAPDMLGRIFEPFFTTKKIGEGTGLGLSQVFGFAKQSGGDLRVDSEVGKGTTFTLYLPRAYPAEEIVPDMAAEASVGGDGYCVLVVEDNESVGAFAAEALKELGYDSVLAPSGQHALALLRENCDRFHIVFSDVVMPGMDGMELGEQIRKLYPDVPVILTSGYSHVLAENGKHGFELLHKPYSVEQLSRVLRKAVAWQSTRRSSTAPRSTAS